MLQLLQIKSSKNLYLICLGLCAGMMITGAFALLTFTHICICILKGIMCSFPILYLIIFIVTIYDLVLFKEFPFTKN